MPTLSIERRELAEQPILFVRSRVARHEIATAIGEGVGKAYPYAQKSGFAIAGHPITRYLSTGPGLYDIEVCIPLAAPGSGQGDVIAGVLPAGPTAVAVHAGPSISSPRRTQRWNGGLRRMDCARREDSGSQTSQTRASTLILPTGAPRFTGLSPSS